LDYVMCSYVQFGVQNDLYDQFDSLLSKYSYSIPGVHLFPFVSLIITTPIFGSGHG